MKKLLASLFASSFLILFLNVQDISAKVVVMERGYYEVKKDEVVDDDLFAGAETITIDGTVNGDVYLGAETVRINGVVNGDLHVGAGNFYLTGKVRDDVYVGAGNVSVSGAAIGDSLIAGSGNVNIDDTSEIGGSFLAGAGSVNVDSAVGRNVMIGAGTIALNSSVGGEMRVAGGEVTIGPDTKIAKDLYYVLGDDESNINMSSSASVSGSVNRVENKYVRDEDMEKARRGALSAFKSVRVVGTIISLIGAFIVGYLGLKLFPKTFTDSAKLVTDSFAKSLGVGFLISIAAIPVLIVLLITGVGSALAGVLLLLLLLNCYLSKIVVGLALGNLTSQKTGWKMSVYGVLALGLVLVYLLKMVPMFGFLVTLVIVWTGLGALTLHYKSTLGGK